MTASSMLKLGEIPIGSYVALTTNIQFKYEGVVAAINILENTITLKFVRLLKNENSQTEKKQPTCFDVIFDSVTFWATGIEQIQVKNGHPQSADDAIKKSDQTSKITQTILPSTKNVITDSASSVKDDNSTSKIDVPKVVENPVNDRNLVPSGKRGKNFVAQKREDSSRLPKRKGRFNGNRGVFLYLPPEMALAYQAQGITVFPKIYNGSRRGNIERKRTPRGTDSDSEYSKPYDFESANAKVISRFAKLHLGSESGENSESNGNPDALHNDNDASSHAMLENGASNNDKIRDLEGGCSNRHQVLLKNEYYSQSKCFYDNLSRSESGPRGGVSGRGRKTYIDRNKGLSAEKMNPIVNGENGETRGYFVYNARRERQLNIETFGAMANANIFSQRRRPTGSVSRDLLVQAIA